MNQQDDKYQPEDPETSPKDPQLVDIEEMDTEDVLRIEELTLPEFIKAVKRAQVRSQREADLRPRSATTLFLEGF